jgi:hypothetical protein
LQRRTGFAARICWPGARPSGRCNCLAGASHCIYGIRPRLQSGIVVADFVVFRDRSFWKPSVWSP